MTELSYAGYRFPPEIIRQAIWLYVRFSLSLRDVEDLLAERGITVSYESVRRWVNHFGPIIATNLRRRRPKPRSIWHLDEVYLKIDGKMMYLWRAVDAEGEILDVLVQSKRDKRAAVKLLRKLLKKVCNGPRSTGDGRFEILRRGGPASGHRESPRNWKMEKQPGGEFSSTHSAARGEDAAFQERRLGPEIPFHSRGRLQHIQRPTPSRLSKEPPRSPLRCDGHVVRGRRCSLSVSDVKDWLRLPHHNVTTPFLGLGSRIIAMRIGTP